MLTKNSLKGSLTSAKKVVATTALLSFALVATPTPATSFTLQYVGTNTTTMQWPNVYGAYGDPQSFSTYVLVTISSPVQAGGLVEQNPFNVRVQPLNGAASEPGAIDVLSASAVNGGSGEFLLEYWRHQMPDQLSFQGVLQDTHAAESVAINLVNFPHEVAPNVTVGAFPFGMGVGTQMAGAFASDFSSINVQISGSTIDQARWFYSNISASFYSYTP